MPNNDSTIALFLFTQAAPGENSETHVILLSNNNLTHLQFT